MTLSLYGDKDVSSGTGAVLLSLLLIAIIIISSLDDDEVEDEDDELCMFSADTTCTRFTFIINTVSI